MTNEEKQGLIEHAKSWIADAEAARDDIPFGFDEDTEMELSLIKIALAALTAQPDEWQQRAETAEAGLKVANEHAEKFEREMYLMMDKAEAAESKLAELVPPGWMVLPIEPTKEMKLASRRYVAKTKLTSGPGFYRAMVAAAPTPHD